MEKRTSIRRGMAVMSSDGVQMGRVVEVMVDGFIIEKGQFFLQDLRVPFEDIATCQGDELVLKRDRADLRRMDSKASSGTADRERYNPRPTGETVTPPLPPTHEPVLTERRAAGPGWDPLSVDEEPAEAPRKIGPDDTEPPTRY